MIKRLTIFIVILCIPIIGFAQQDSAKHYKYKKRASPYDTNAIYFNKWKLNFDFDIGVGDFSSIISGTPGTQRYAPIPGIFGELNPVYNQAILPSFNFTTSYGITEKSAIGLAITFQQTDYIPAAPNLTSGDLLLAEFEARYLHCIRSWKYFYYGFEYGVIVFQNNSNSNTFINKTVVLSSFTQNDAGWFIGIRYPIAKKIWIHYDAQENISLARNSYFPLLNEEFGLNYCIDTRKNYHKPVKYDPVLLQDSIKRYYIKVEDSARARHKRLDIPWDSAAIQAIISKNSNHTRSVYDSLSPYYNKDKLNLSIESGNSDIDAVALSMFGTINPDYNQTLVPLLSFCADYGIRKKSDIGVDFTFMQVDYTPQLSGTGLTPGNVSAYTIEVRYLHCMWSWKYFYYGFKLGAIFWQPEFNSNTFYDPPKTPQALIQPNLGALLGVRVTILRNLFIHGELLANGPFAAVDYGLTYRINTGKKSAKK